MVIIGSGGDIVKQGNVFPTIDGSVYVTGIEFNSRR
jgi:hypothetical protein